MADIRLEKDGDIAEIILNRPDKKNALNRAMWDAIPDLIADATSDKAIRVIVVHGG